MTDTRLIFHLSFPVADLQAARNFYVEVLGASIGRVRDTWIDLLLWGHQITLQLDPGAVTDLDGQGKRHFGTVLPWDNWQRLADAVVEQSSQYLVGTPVKTGKGELAQAKLYLRDPSNNVIEIKAYRDFAAVLGTREPGYDGNRVG